MARIPEKDRKRVGTFLHSCGQVAPVFQMRGRLHLYLHCPQCGCIQDGRAETQTAIFRDMVKELPFQPPRNLLPEAAPATEKTEETRATTENPAPETKPESEPTPAPATETNAVPAGGGGLGLVLIFLGLLGFGVAVTR